MIDDHESGQGGVGPTVRIGHRTPQVLAAYIFGHAAKLGAPFVIFEFRSYLIVTFGDLVSRELCPGVARSWRTPLQQFDRSK